MKKDKFSKTEDRLLRENEKLRIRLEEAEDTLQAIREGAVDAIVVSGRKGEQIFTLTGEEQIYRRLVETMGEGGLTTTTEGKILFCNRQFGEMVGLPMEEIVGHNLEDFIKKSDRRNMASLLVGAQLMPSRKRLVFESSDKTYVPAWVSANLLDSGDSVSICFVAMDQTKLEASEETIRQISEQKEELMAQQEELRSQNDQLTESEASIHRLNRVLKALSSSNHAMMRAVDETHYLQEVCNVIDKDCGYAMVWIGYAQDDQARTVRPVASAGFEKGYLETMNITWANNERGRGPTGTAIRTGKVCMCKNMLTDPAFEPWRKEAIKRGFASSI
jgi:PAS domain S-box-containing protein